MTWLKRIAIVIAVLAGLLAAAAWWLLGTGSGMHFVLDRVVAATDGALSVRQAHGTLAGPLQLEGMRYADGDGTEVRVDQASVDVALWPLLGKTLRVDKLEASGVHVGLPASKPSQPEEDSQV